MDNYIVKNNEDIDSCQKILENNLKINYNNNFIDEYRFCNFSPTISNITELIQEQKTKLNNIYITNTIYNNTNTDKNTKEPKNIVILKILKHI